MRPPWINYSARRLSLSTLATAPAGRWHQPYTTGHFHPPLLAKLPVCLAQNH
uniref:Uncharacterized protein n=1 Tax=Arundo donax TaxID=35708 RepID=A0A0A9DUY9_ARUDO